MAATGELPQSTLWEDLKSVKTWFVNLFLPTLKGRPACKPTMPAVIPTVVEQLRQVMSEDSSPDAAWTFVDLGCGQGMMLQPMRDAMIDGRRMFEKVVGVELDPNTHREAEAAHDDPAIEVVCGDMFPFVEKACS